MDSLLPLVRGYLKSAGFNIIEEQDDLLIADRVIVSPDRDTWIVWAVPPGPAGLDYETRLAPQVRNARTNYPDAKAFILAHERAGFSRDFQAELTALRIRFLTPIEFFDADFRFESAREAISALSELRSKEILRKRIPQPFTVDERVGAGPATDDLLRALQHELTRAGGPAVYFVVGKAGIGKSFLYRALFASIYDRFLRAKQTRASFPRPIPLLPEHRRQAYGLRTQLVLESFLSTEVATPVRRETFEWLLVNGFMIWLLDGLDELYSGDPGFFDYLLDLITRDGSKSKVVVCCRDSLLTTCDAFVDFREWCGGGSETIKIYRLLEWERASKRGLAWLRTEGKLPEASAHDPSHVTDFLRRIDASGPLKTLSGVPYYCDELLTLHREGRLREFGSDLDLVNEIVDGMVRREEEKQLLDPCVFVSGGLRDWLEEVATDYVEGGCAGVKSADALSYGELVVREDIPAERRRNALTTLLQFPLFVAGAQGGYVRFAHELVASSLAAKAYLRRLRADAAGVGYRLGDGPIPSESVVMRHMATMLDQLAEQAVVNALTSGALAGHAFRNLLSLLMLARPGRDTARKAVTTFDSADLSGVCFDNRNLQGLSFRSADLSHTHFRGCDLRNALFEGAFVSETQFDNCDLRNAQFGDFDRVHSFYDGRKRFSERRQFEEWAEQVTGRVQPRLEPCPAALQLRHLFGKFITPLGQARRDDLQHQGLVAGKRFEEAPTPEECLKAACQSGYLVGPDFRHRYRRPEGDRYAEMVRFVKDSAVSEELGRLLSRLCRRRSCVHQLKA